MGISPVSHLNSVYGSYGVEGKPRASEPPEDPKPAATDTVQLSFAAKAYLKAAGLDGDGDDQQA
jgi:hypothetical protein